jgi:hypothetical protein
MTRPLSEFPAVIVSATPIGSRLRLTPHLIREPLVPTAGVFLQVGGAFAVVLTSFVLLGSAFMSRPLGWFVLFEVFVGIYILFVTLGMSLTVYLAGARQQSVELRTAGNPAEVVVTTGWRGRHREVIALVGLRRVVVCETHRLGQRSALDVTLHLGDGRQVTGKASAYLVKSASARELAGWLEGQLGPADVPVRHESRVDREFQCPEQWWQRGTVASLWQVRASEVARIAGERMVPAHPSRRGHSRCTARIRR